MDVKVETINLFPIPLYRTTLDGISDELGLEQIVRDKILETKGLQGIRNYPGGIHQASAVQTPPNLHELDEMQPFKESIFEVIGSIMTEQELDTSYKIDMTAMWGNLQPQHHAFHRHSHHNNIFAGVFYVNQGIDYLATSRQNFPHIVFWNPRRNDQLNPIRNPSNPVNRFNFTVEIKQDLLVIFPAWLEHEVPINMAKKDRISISFNIMLRGRFSEINSKESTVL